MTEFLLSPAARADLGEIWDYTAGRWGTEQAEQYIRALTTACQELAGQRRTGRAIGAVRAGYFKLSWARTSCAIASPTRALSISSAFCTNGWMSLHASTEPPPAVIGQPPWLPSVGISVHVRPEWAFTMRGIRMLDTNIVSDLIRNPQGRVARHIREVGEARVCTSIIVAAALRYGATKTGSPRLTAQLEAVLGALDVLPFETPADTAYGLLRARLEQAGQPIGGNDLLIAAHAVALGCAIVTDNERALARIDDLPRENWLRDA